MLCCLFNSQKAPAYKVTRELFYEMEEVTVCKCNKCKSVRIKNSNWLFEKEISYCEDFAEVLRISKINGIKLLSEVLRED